jgi:hypothetical protein
MRMTIVFKPYLVMTRVNHHFFYKKNNIIFVKKQIVNKLQLSF